MSYGYSESPVIWEQTRSLERKGENQCRSGVFYCAMCESLLFVCC